MRRPVCFAFVTATRLVLPLAAIACAGIGQTLDRRRNPLENVARISDPGSATLFAASLLATAPA